MATHTIRSVRRFFVEHFDFLHLISVYCIALIKASIFSHQCHNTIRYTINNNCAVEAVHQCFVVNDNTIVSDFTATLTVILLRMNYTIGRDGMTVKAATHYSYNSHYPPLFSSPLPNKPSCVPEASLGNGSPLSSASTLRSSAVALIAALIALPAGIKRRGTGAGRPECLSCSVDMVKFKVIGIGCGNGVRLCLGPS